MQKEGVLSFLESVDIKGFTVLHYESETDEKQKQKKFLMKT